MNATTARELSTLARWAWFTALFSIFSLGVGLVYYPEISGIIMIATAIIAAPISIAFVIARTLLKKL